MKGRTEKEVRLPRMGMDGLSIHTDKKRIDLPHQEYTEESEESSSQTLRESVEAAFRSGNVCNRVQVLRDLYSKVNALRANHRCRMLPRIQFLAQMRCFLQSRGLVLDSETMRRFRDISRKDMFATV